jgi:hypothetical protein
MITNKNGSTGPTASVINKIMQKKKKKKKKNGLIGEFKPDESQEES